MCSIRNSAQAGSSAGISSAGQAQRIKNEIASWRKKMIAAKTCAHAAIRGAHSSRSSVIVVFHLGLHDADRLAFRQPPEVDGVTGQAVQDEQAEQYFRRIA